MASVYAQLTDCVDPALSVTALHLSKADVFVDQFLYRLGTKRSLITLPKTVLTEIAANWAMRLAAIEGAIGDNTTLIAKAKEYEKNADRLMSTVTLDSLGITPDVPSASGFGIGAFSRS